MPNLLDYCSGLPTRSVPKGDLVLEEDVKDNMILVLKSGAVEIVKHGATITTISNRGAMLGDMSVLLGRGHTASAVAALDSEFYVIEHAGEQLEAHPELYREIARSLASRLMRQSEKNIELQDRLEIRDGEGELDRRLAIMWGLD